eukprot:8700910-Alexandrium_andersonii.AAC.1
MPTAICADSWDEAATPARKHGQARGRGCSDLEKPGEGSPGEGCGPHLGPEACTRKSAEFA